MKKFSVLSTTKCGSGWFVRLCDIHSDIELKTEKIKAALKLPQAKDIETAQEKEERRKCINEAIVTYLEKALKECGKKVFGTIKIGQSPAIIKWQEDNGFHLTQLLRHPVSIISYGMAKTYYNRDYKKSPQVIFEEKVAEYFRIYSSFVEYSAKYRLFKLEDLNTSLATDCVYFKEAIEDITCVEWNDALIQQIKKPTICPLCKGTGIATTQYHWLPCDKCHNVGRCYNEEHQINRCTKCQGKTLVLGQPLSCQMCGGKDITEHNRFCKKVWDIWTDWQKEMFRSYFDSHMEALGYAY